MYDDDNIEDPVMMCDAHGVCAGEDCPRFNECTRKDDAEHDWF